MAKDAYRGPLERVNECCWRIPKSYKPGMRVDGLIFADDELIEQIRNDQAPEQVANVAFLPGIQHASLAMPDIHWGYGFCIGGVCATDPKEKSSFSFKAEDFAGELTDVKEEGDSASASFKGPKDEKPEVMKFKKIDGRWLIDLTASLKQA